MVRLEPLRVLSPCDVSPTELEPGALGSHCRRCNTPVHDLTGVSEARARALGLLHGPRFCGRIRVDARGRGVFTNDALAGPALAMVAALGAAGCAAPPPPPMRVEPIETSATQAPIAREAVSAAPTTEPEPDREPSQGRIVIGESVGMIILRPVRFAPSSVVPPPEGRPLLDEVANAILANTDTMPLVRVEGHADAKEPNAEAVSKRRAEEVVEYLVIKGVPRERLVAAGEGTKRPIAENDTAEGRAKNRRIEFHVVR